MSSFVLGFPDIDKTKLPIVGGKGANLGELCKIKEIHVPDGFCVSTEAFRQLVTRSSTIDGLLDQLSHLRVEDRNKIAELSAELRRAIEALVIPKDVQADIVRLLSRSGAQDAYAVRSSATAEDLPTASFAGQHDTYLNVIGTKAILEHIRKCWASLFSERAVTYRLQNGFDHQNVQLAVVVQKMVFPQVAGILFTADPGTSNRKVSSIDASFGLGEALVSGLVNADVYKVRDGKVMDKTVSTKKLAIQAVESGGTREQKIEPERQNRQAMTDEQILQLDSLGRKIEAHFGCPQDIEWCLVDDTFYIVQSRPITTLYPIPEVHDHEYHVYISVAHQQMMTDALKPLGLSLFQLTAARPMFKAGGRLFVDVTQNLASPSIREVFLNAMGQHDPLLKDALTTIVERGDLDEPVHEDKGPGTTTPVLPPAGPLTLFEDKPNTVYDLIERDRRSLEALKNGIQSKSGPDVFDFILEDLQHLRRNLFDPQGSAVFMAAINASTWINEKIEAWLGEKGAADILSQSVPNNVTSEMGLALLDVADAIRPYPDVIDYLQRANDDNFLNELPRLAGGIEAQKAIHAFLDKYGMRCAGEIDITKDRWSEKPTTLVPMILGNIKNFAPNASQQKFEQGRQEALNKAQELLERLKQLPDGDQKASETKQRIDLLRNFIGYREYPKYGLVNRYFVYKQAILKEAARLAQANVIQETEDIYYLTLQELHETARTNKLDKKLINQRKEEYQRYEKLTPPRVITSDGEIGAGKYKRENLPADALVGLPVSAGVIEGRARVITDLKDAVLEDGDILVTAFTDPSWTTLFVSIKGLVTEVGGLMTHGAVIAREYGLPAVVGVENATHRIKDGQRIRVHGTEGYIELL